MENIRQDVAVLEHRVKSLEQDKPKVTRLVGEMSEVRSDIAELKSDFRTIKNLVVSVDDKISRLFWTGAGVMMACSGMASIAAIVWKAIKSGVIT